MRDFLEDEHSKSIKQKHILTYLHINHQNVCTYRRKFDSTFQYNNTFLPTTVLTPETYFKVILKQNHF